MGEHKYNPTAIKSKNGKLPPKKPTASKREIDRAIRAEIERKVGIAHFRKAITCRYFN